MPGKSDLVCSSEISVGEVLRKARKLTTVLRETTLNAEEIGDAWIESASEEQKIHEAIGILRRHM